MNPLTVSARLATSQDVDDLCRLYGELESEMADYHRMWRRADALATPIDRTMAQLVDDSDAVVAVGELDGMVFGLLIGYVEELVDGSLIGALRFIFTDHAAREVGVGEAMRDTVLATFRERGLRRFDAHVLPGHRLVKNFFEAGGFAARSIVMHHDDER